MQHNGGGGGGSGHCCCCRNYHHYHSTVVIIIIIIYIILQCFISTVYTKQQEIHIFSLNITSILDTKQHSYTSRLLTAAIIRVTTKTALFTAALVAGDYKCSVL